MNFRFVLVFLGVLCFQPLSISAQQEFPQTGMLAAFGDLSPASELNLPLPLGLAPGGSTPMITGNISRAKNNEWLYQVTNNSDRVISVNLEIRTVSSDFERVGTQSTSKRLNTGETASDKMKFGSNVIGAALVLTGWSYKDKKR